MLSSTSAHSGKPARTEEGKLYNYVGSGQICPDSCRGLFGFSLMWSHESEAWVTTQIPVSHFHKIIIYLGSSDQITDPGRGRGLVTSRIMKYPERHWWSGRDQVPHTASPESEKYPDSQTGRHCPGDLVHTVGQLWRMEEKTNLRSDIWSSSLA